MQLSATVRALYLLVIAVLFMAAGIINNMWIGVVGGVMLFLLDTPFFGVSIKQLDGDISWLRYIELLIGVIGIILIIANLFLYDYSNNLLGRFGIIIVGMGLCLTVIRSQLILMGYKDKE